MSARVGLKIGLITGREWSFPPRFIDAVNARDNGVTAEYALLGGESIDGTCSYAVLIDRISHEVPFYRSYLKHAVLQGVAVVNNPFMWSADDKFFGATLATRLGVASPRTILVPNKEYVPGIVHAESLRNLKFPIDWDAIVREIGMPCILKDAHGGGWKDVYVCRTKEELLTSYDQSGLHTMIVQEFIEWDQFVRCICIGQQHVLPIRYDPKARAYLVDDSYLSDALRQRIVRDSLTLVRALGYDMNSIEYAVKDDVPYAIDFMNPAPDFDVNSLTLTYFDWAVQHMADLAIALATRGSAGGDATSTGMRCSRGGGECAPSMTSGVGEAIARYHELLTADVAAESQAMLDEAQRRRGVYFGDRPLCTALRPRFFSSDQYRFVRERCGVMLKAMGRLLRAALQDASLRRQFRLTEWEEDLVALDPGIPDPSPTSRFDSFYFPETGVMWLTEYNAETPTGAAYGDTLADVFMALPVMRQFLKTMDVRPIPGRHGILHAVLGSYAAWSGTRAAPRIAILDWREVPTFSEFVLFQEYFRSHGLEAVIVDPRETELKNGRLMAEGGPVDLIYKRVLISELIDRCGIDHAVVRAVRSRSVCMVNGFRCKLLHKKASFAVLGDERNAALFPPDERQAIAAHIPWTRVLEERKTRHDGQEIDLVPFVLSQRDRLVLKPNDEYGGKGVVLGWEVSDAEWQERVRHGLTDPHVVQERVPVPREPYPSVVDGALQIADRILDTDPFACQGAYVDGCLSRLSTAALVNVTAGGGSQVPTMLVEPR